ncbi:hypothetical protein Hanom_Chr08g00702441 [Helianthus anomalus]
MSLSSFRALRTWLSRSSLSTLNLAYSASRRLTTLSLNSLYTTSLFTSLFTYNIKHLNKK